MRLSQVRPSKLKPLVHSVVDTSFDKDGKWTCAFARCVQGRGKVF